MAVRAVFSEGQCGQWGRCERGRGQCGALRAVWAVGTVWAVCGLVGAAGVGRTLEPFS